VLVVIAGHQIVTAEKLEVLALCCPPEVREGEPLEATIAAVRSCGGVPLLPWGFGKWMFSRGKCIARVVEGAAPWPLLGDNGGRPALSWTPRLLRRGAARGIPVLPGSDPLPFADQVRRVGRVGVIMEAALDLERPATSVRKWLITLRPPLRPFGNGLGPWEFARDQLRMQWRKRRMRDGGR